MAWNTIEAVLFELGKWVFVAYFLMFLLSVMLERKVSSLVITLMVLALANGAMTASTPMLYNIASQTGLFYKFIWYMAFVCVDGIAIYLLYKFHRLLKQNVGSVAQLVGSCFFLLASIQSLRFFDRYVTDTELLQPFYQYGIPIINVALVPIILMMWALQQRNENNSTQVVTE
ncbi:hypothetical protein ABGI61_05640 [Rheinheimera sp. FR7-31]|uniref:hypothetical protein n=1 Tax=Rheinheimera fenheensis TaxID=3152295 RepID=UPI00325C35D5